MAEVNSKQAANKVAVTKNHPADHNRVRCLVITTPDAWNAAQGDIMPSGQMLPAGFRPLSVRISCAAGAASSTISVGHRKASDKTGADADSLVASQAINAAGTFTPTDGTLTLNGLDGKGPDYEVEPYLAFGGANPQANQDIRVEILYIAP